MSKSKQKLEYRLPNLQKSRWNSATTLDEFLQTGVLILKIVDNDGTLGLPFKTDSINTYRLVVTDNSTNAKLQHMRTVTQSITYTDNEACKSIVYTRTRSYVNGTYLWSSWVKPEAITATDINDGSVTVRKLSSDVRKNIEDCIRTTLLLSGSTFYTFQTEIGTGRYGTFPFRKNYCYKFVFTESGYDKPVYKALKSNLDDSVFVESTTSNEFTYRPNEDVEAYLSIYSGAAGTLNVTVTSLPIVQKSIADNLGYEAMPVTPIIVKSKYTDYETGIPTDSGSYFTQYYYEIGPYIGREVNISCNSSSASSAVVAFYSSAIASDSSYMKDVSVQATGGYEFVKTTIPDGASLMVVTHRDTDIGFKKPTIVMKGLVDEPGNSAISMRGINVVNSIVGIVLNTSYCRGFFSAENGTEIISTTSTNTAVSNTYVKVAPNTEYKLIGSNGYKIAVYLYDDCKNFIEAKHWFSEIDSFVTDKNVDYVRIGVRKDNIDLSQIPDITINPDKTDNYTALNTRYVFKEGLKFSILGDSLSTFTGYIPDSNIAYYPESSKDVSAVYKTWWWQCIRAFGGILDVNNSYSGSSISTIRSDRPTFVERCTSLGNPDVIFIHGGTNDITYSAPLGVFDPSADSDTLDLSTLAGGCDRMVRLIRAVYPNARVIAILPKTSKKNYITLLREMYEYYNIEMIDLNSIDISLTSNHYTAYGMTQVSGYVTRLLSDKAYSDNDSNVFDCIKVAPIGKVQSSFKVIYETGEFVPAGTYWKYLKFDTKGLKDIEVTGKWYDGVNAAIAFYDENDIYLKEASVSGTKGELTKGASIPMNAAYAICCSAEISPVVKTHSIGAVVDSVPQKYIDPIKAFHNPFIGKPFYHHLNQEQVSDIPAQSLYDIAYAKALGFQVIEANVHKCNDGIYVTKHGKDGKLGAGLVFAEGCGITADTAFGSVTSADLRAYVTYDTPLPQYAGHIPTLDEFCAECKRLGMTLLLRAVNETESLRVVQKYLHDSEIILCGVSQRNDFTGLMITFQDVNDDTTVESVLNICENFGKPYVFGGFWSSAMSDEKIREITTVLHKNGYLAGAAYAYRERVNKLASLGIDLFASDGDVNLFDCGNRNNIFSVSELTKSTNVAINNGIATIPTDGTISLRDEAFNGRFGKVLLSILFDGDIAVSIGSKTASQFQSNGTSYITVAEVCNSDSVVSIMANSDTIVKGIKVLSSVVM